MQKKDHNILIVGQGLAGTLMSFTFLKHNIKHSVVDNHHHESSTHIAAGLVNPLTGRKYVKSWRIDDLLPFALDTYHELEELLDVDLISHQNILRTLRTPVQQNQWSESTGRIGYENYFEDNSNGQEYESFLVESCKFGEVTNSIRVNISGLISAYKEYLLENEMIAFDQLNYNEIKLTEQGIKYKDKSYTSVIFCEGHKATHNPYFSKLGFQLAKGEALILNFANFKANKILRDEIFFAPDSKMNFWCGGGYKWQFENANPTLEWKEQWLKKIEKITNLEFDVIEHKAGIRPCVKDRKPLLGSHPKFKQLMIFNGLGTKGTSLGPYWANHLYEHLNLGRDIEDEVNISRYL